MFTPSSQFVRALEKIDEHNSEDPNVELVDGVAHPKELLYSRRMTERLQTFEPNASEAVRLAARAQHVRRWESPRANYPMDRAGYHRWRTDLYRFHARIAGEVLQGVGYDSQTIGRVQSMIRKEAIKSDPDGQMLEDVICLVFLEHYFAPFSERHDEAKLIGIIRRTWKKMSDRGREAALALQLPQDKRALIEKALSGVS